MPPSSSLHLPSLVGREREIAMLRDQWRAALDGHGSLALIGGEAGIGKTAIAERLCRDAMDAGAPVLIGRCYDLTETPPYGPWLELVGQYRQVTDAMPAIPPAFAARGTVGVVSSQAALFQQVHDFFAAVAEQGPVVLLLDDLHWSDPASLDLLRFLARDLATIPVLLLATYRSDELVPEHPLARLLPALARESRATRLDLPRLETADVRTLVTGRYNLPDADRERLVAHLHERAEGNPFFTEEILRTLEEGRMLRAAPDGWRLGEIARAHIPPLVRQVIEGRLVRLDGERRHLLAVAAVIGQEVPLALWATVAGVAEDALLPTIERAMVAHLMEETEDRVGMRFTHALIRETLYDAIPLPIRRDGHRRTAEALIGASHPDPDAVANHLRRAGDTRAVRWLIDAAERAYRAYAFMTAAERYEAALRLVSDGDARQRGWLLYRLGVVHRFRDPWRGAAYIEDALRDAEAEGDELLRASALAGRANQYTLIGSCRQALDDWRAAKVSFEALATRASSEIESAGMAQQIREARDGTVFCLALTGRYAEALAEVDILIAEEDAASTPRFGLANTTMSLHTAAIALAALGRIDDARTATERAYAGLQREGRYYPAAMTYINALYNIVLRCDTDHIEERRERTAAAEDEYRRVTEVHADPHPEVIRLPLRVIEGDWDEAWDLAIIVATTRPVAWQCALYPAVAALALARGERTILRQLIKRVFPDGPATPPGGIWFDYAVAMQHAAAALALAAGDLPAMHAWLEATDRWFAWSGAVIGRSDGQILWAHYYKQAGDLPLAMQHAEEARIHATQPRQPLALLTAHRLLGELNIIAGRFDDAAHHLDESLALADACSAPYERALTQLAFATLRAATGKRETAKALLAEVRSVCERLEARPALGLAEVLAAHIGAVAPARSHGGLTAREVEVLRLAAQGLDNPAIAAHLSLSAHTIHRHMANIRTKLDLPSRTAAVAWAMRHGVL